MTGDDRSRTLRRLRDYERLSAWLWLILGIVQVLMVLTIIAGVWNIIAAISRFGMAKRIEEGDARVPDEYESIVQLTLIGIVNIIFGAVVGIVFVIFDFYQRSQILENREIFTGNISTENVSYPAQDKFTLLEEIDRLRKSGVLSEEEFTDQKRRILGF